MRGRTLNSTRLSRLVEMSHYPRDGVSTVLLASEKPIVRSPAPQRFNQELLARISHRDRTLLRGRAAQNRRRRLSLSSQYSWSTTSGEAAAEGCLPTPKYPVPVTTLEQHADPVTQRGKNLALPEPSIWQQFAREWDMLQARCPMKPRTKAGINLLVALKIVPYSTICIHAFHHKCMIYRPKITQTLAEAASKVSENRQPSSTALMSVDKTR